jgi:hypothetical protein
MNDRPDIPREREFDDPLLRERLRSITAATTPPPALVAVLERRARTAPERPAHLWAERLPALASLGLVASMFLGAVTSFPVADILAPWTGGGRSGLGSSPMIVAGMFVLALGGLATIDALRGASWFRRLGR